MSQSEKIVVRKSEERGHATHSWLEARHTFSFASYHDSLFNSFGSLRVINEDFVKANKGFGPHPHEDFEIISYVVNGEITHKDSMGNTEVVGRSGVQYTSAGSGIIHSEVNNHKSDTLHLLQLWILPSEEGLAPRYETRVFSDEQKRNALLQIVQGAGGDSKEAISIRQDARIYASILDHGKTVAHTSDGKRRQFIHVCLNTKKWDRFTDNHLTNQSAAERSILANGKLLKEGDGAFITGTERLEIVGNGVEPAEFLLFDLA